MFNVFSHSHIPSLVFDVFSIFIPYAYFSFSSLLFIFLLLLFILFPFHVTLTSSLLIILFNL